MTFQIAIPLSNLPLTLLCRGDATLSIQPSQNFKYFTDGVVQFDMTGFTINGVQYNYGEFLKYKEIPELFKWLQSLNMDMPSFQQQSPFHGFSQGFGFQ
jgi:hypothetical protein